jgi:hypothetical protein
MIGARALSLAALLLVPAGLAGAQSPWPDSPSQPSKPAAASPWPDAQTQAPAASPWPSSPTQPAAPGGASPWSSSPAAPQAAAPDGASPWNAARPQQRDCNAEFMPLRQDAEKRAGAIKAAAAKKSQPALCAAFKNFAVAEAKMVKYVADNAANCGIPPDVGKNMRANHAKTTETRDRICSANAGPAAPRAPSLSDALGTSRLPETGTQSQRGGGTFNTLTGNAITR